MSSPSVSSAEVNIVEAEKKEYLYAAVRERQNPFGAFDWGDHVIVPPQYAQPGLIATSNPLWSSSPRRHAWRTSSPVDERGWTTTIKPEVLRLATESGLPWNTMYKYYLAEDKDGLEYEVIHFGIDVSRPVNKADAEAFVQRCSDMLASHQLDDTTVVEVHHSSYWGSWAER